MAKTVPFSMRLDPALKERLQRTANRKRRSLTNLAEAVLEDYVERDEIGRGERWADASARTPDYSATNYLVVVDGDLRIAFFTDSGMWEVNGRRVVPSHWTSIPTWPLEARDAHVAKAAEKKRR